VVVTAAALTKNPGQLKVAALAGWTARSHMSGQS
jgi:hypothetical protein